MDQDTLNLALLQYCFTSGEHEVKIAPHGNSKCGSAYIRTMPSVMTKLKEAATQKTPKRALQFVSDEQGGVLGATSAGALPRSRQQVKDMRRNLKQDDDPLFSLMFMCKAEEGKGKDQFVRVVNAAPFPMMVLAYDYMLADLSRFCTNQRKFSILGVDPTFSLGDFDVTVTTYHHLMLSSKTSSKHPTVIGPLFIHVKKDFTAYHFFSSSLIGQQPNLVNLRAFGIDGEVALANALSASFPKAVHVRCFLHFKGNIEHKLSELRIPANVAKEFVDDIMGKPTEFQLGLVDAKDPTHLDEMLTKFQSVWNDREKPFNSPPIFFSWFQQYQRGVIAESMVQMVRTKAGLGNPPVPYYTNEVESKNHILKQHVHYKASELPAFVDSMKNLLQLQRKEIERSVIAQGEYKLQDDYKKYSVQSTKWFTLTADQRLKHLDKFMSATITEPVTEMSVESSVTSTSCPLNVLSVPTHFAANMWNKAQKLSSSDDGMVQCPGDSSSWMVKSESSKRPHFVKAGKCGGYLCDEECLAYKSAKICAHTVAVAIKTGSVQKLLKWHNSRKIGGPNLTAVAEARKPKTAGKKRKGVTKKSAKKIKSIISDVDELAWHYPHESQGDSSNADLVQSGTDLSQSSVVSSPQKVDVHSNKEQVTVNTGTLQVNYSNVQIAGPPPLVKSLPLSNSQPSAYPAVASPYTQYTVSPPPLTQYSRRSSSPSAIPPPSTLNSPFSPSIAMPPPQAHTHLSLSSAVLLPHTQNSQLSSSAMPQPHTQDLLSPPSVPSPLTQYSSSSPGMPSCCTNNSLSSLSMPPPHTQLSSAVPPPHTQLSSPALPPTRTLTSPAVPPPLNQYSPGMPPCCTNSLLSSSVMPPTVTQCPPSTPALPPPPTQYSLSSPGMSSVHPECLWLSPLVHTHSSSPEMSTQNMITQWSASLTRPSVESPFWVALLFGNVSRCNGCKGKIRRGPDNKPLPPPDNIILGHKEYVIFNNPKTGRFEQSWEKHNVYYHPWKTCVAPNFADFNPCRHLVVKSDIRNKLQPSHIQLLEAEFGVNL